MAKLNHLRIPAASRKRRPPRGDRRRRLAWMVVFVVVSELQGVRPAEGQFEASGLAASPTGGVPMVLAAGDGSLAIPIGVSVLGLAVYDIASAAESARVVNARRRENVKSPATAAGLSMVATLLPLAVGYSRQTPHPELLIVGGIILGPSVGHLYAGRPLRGLLTAGLRAGLGSLVLVSSIASP